jgi:hypothetical protein
MGCINRTPSMHTQAPCDDWTVPYLVAALIAAAAAAVGWLARPLSPDPDERRQVGVALNAVDRELAANLELTTMFDQTKQAVTLENGEFVRHRATLERNARSAAAAIAALYERMAEAESAMERRGPANSLRPEDRRLIEAWEGDAREVQHSLRAALEARPTVGLAAMSARLHGRFARQ